ncbi:general substrate transporter [Penicillium malachiteum]|uniref:General substrate transporter n=1 Tax=Penicillium malachiteum TaxID=1324776 RepID=A0AAD6HA58_9EURO|nr:general substrate transporter [Penicillium malachiteum]
MLVGQIIAVAGIDVRLLNYTPSSYRVLFAVELAPTGFAIIAAFLCPESPTIYAKLGKHTQAIRAYTRLFSAEEAEEAVTNIESSLEHERQAQANDESPSYMECFRGTNWRRTRIVLYANMLQNFVGVAMVNQCTYFMELGGMSPYVSLCLLMSP